MSCVVMLGTPSLTGCRQSTHSISFDAGTLIVISEKMVVVFVCDVFSYESAGLNA